MEIKYSDNICVLKPYSLEMNDYETTRIAREVAVLKCSNIALDLSFVQQCSFEFIEFLSETSAKISMYNINSDVFSLFNIMGIDKIAKLYVSEIDFEEKKRQLLNRKFVVV